MEEEEAQRSRPLLKNPANRADGNIASRVTRIAPNFSAIVPASFIRARFGDWNTKRRFFLTAPATICAPG